MEYKDYYQTLGVDRGADEKDIKKAFRRLARQHHPDVNPGDAKAEERFKEINEAHEVLSDPEKRGKYDQLGSAYQDWQRTGGQPSDFNWRNWAGGARGGGGAHVRYGTPEDLQDMFGGGSPFSDFFSQIFGGTGRGAQQAGFQHRVQPRRGQDYVQEVEITLTEAHHGSARAMQKEGRRLEVKIPAGARTGTRVRMAGEGGPGAAGGPAGDLFLKITVAEDPRFERKGDDLHTTVPTGVYAAILGGQTEVPTLAGSVLLTIPANTQNGRVFRLRGKGMPRLQQPDQHGDLFAKVDVQLPKQVSAREQELFGELRTLSEEGQ